MIKRFKLLLSLILVGFLAFTLSSCIMTTGYGQVKPYGGCSGLSILAMQLASEVSGLEYQPDGRYHLTFRDETRNPSEIYLTELQIHNGLSLLPANFYDPIVIQMPSDVKNIWAYYDDQAGKAGDMLVTAGLESVKVTPTQSMVPEPGHQLVIIDFPDSDLIPGPGENMASYQISFTGEADSLRDIDIKAMCTAKIQKKNGETFYIPLLPAVMDFSKVPVITIPNSTTLQEIPLPSKAEMPTTPDLITYDFQDKLYYPHIASKNSWETEVCIINTSSSATLTGNLIAYNNAGVQLSSTAVSLAANARVEYTVSSDFADPANIGYMIFESNSGDMCGYMKFFIDTQYRGAIPAASQVNTSNVYIPHIASNTTWWTGVSLLNTTDAEKTLTIEFSDGTVKTKTIAANEHQVFTIKSLFSGVAQPNIKSAVIKNASGIVGLELFASNAGSGDNYLSGVLLKNITSKNLYFPHIANVATWWTGIVAYNPSSMDAAMTITPYKEDGTVLTAQTANLKPGIKYIKTADTLNFPAGAAWFHISSTRALTGFELFGTNDRKQLGGYTSVNINRTSGVFPKIETSGWTGIALVNIENSNTAVTLTAYGDDGTVIDTAIVVLTAHEKLVKTAPALFSKDISTATYIAYSAVNEIVGFQLNGSTDSMMLDALPGM
jgi:hypothetical protein